jgi:hypothetical protein
MLVFVLSKRQVNHAKNIHEILIKYIGEILKKAVKTALRVSGLTGDETQGY